MSKMAKSKEAKTVQKWTVRRGQAHSWPWGPTGAIEGPFVLGPQPVSYFL